MTIQQVVDDNNDSDTYKLYINSHLRKMYECLHTEPERLRHLLCKGT